MVLPLLGVERGFSEGTQTQGVAFTISLSTPKSKPCGLGQTLHTL